MSLAPATSGRVTQRTALRWPTLNWGWVCVAVLFALVAFMTAYPTLLIFLGSFQTSRPGEAVAWGLEGWQAAFGDPSMARAMGNTFFLAGVRIFLATSIAVFFAWVVTRTDTPFRGAIEFTLWLGYFLPQLPMVMGWILLLDPQYGVINQALRPLLGMEMGPLDIYSYGGIIWAHMAYSTSIRFLLLTPAFRVMDAALEEAAAASGANRLTTLLRVTIPVLAPAILAAIALGFIKALQSFEIEMALGIPVGIYVYSTEIWESTHWEPPRYDQATALSSLFLLVIFGMVLVQRLVLGRRQYTTISGRGYSARTTSLGRWRWVTFGICATWIGVMILLPLSFLVLGTFMRLFGFFDLPDPWTTRHWAEALDDPIFLKSLGNTLVLGLGAGLCGALFCALVSYVLIRTRFFGRGVMDFLSWLPWALPGIVLGLALLWGFLGNPVLRVMYGTIYLMILALVISELPLGTQMLKAAVMQVSKELEESAWISGASWLRTFYKVVLPLLMPSLVAVGLVIFISAIREIPTIVLLSTAETRTLSLLMLDYMTGSQLEKAVVLGVFITLVIVIAALVARYGLRFKAGLGEK